MSAVDEYRSGTESFNRSADQRILNAIAGPAHYVMHLADAAIAEMDAALAGRDWMLRLAWDESIGVAGNDEVEAAYSAWLADLRARSADGSDT